MGSPRARSKFPARLWAAMPWWLVRVWKEMETLKKHLPFSGEEELKEIAVRFEEKIFTVATSQQHYLRKISLKMLTMDSKSQNPTANSLQPNAASDNGTNPQDPECE
ncbi:Mediator of RNA polymerase II transcription subunit 15a [Castilleja foliolosa]|uniref:Mediator of RNA polymerase II transcription subunit 15a n=1 Tax=Castilleja foliolosa TaxID=1961234 RepID=A0ABD3C249_9LAMI